MNKEELLECLKNLSTTNNKRDGIEIKREEAQLIIETINKQKEVLDKIKEKCLSIKGNPEHTIVSKNELVKQFLELLEEIE